MSLARDLSLQKLETWTLKRLFALSLTGAAVLASVSAQVPEGASLGGVVIDSQRGDPLPQVNVFLANTTLGSVTDIDGRFLIAGIPAGVYDLIVSSPAYQRDVRRIEIRQKDRTDLRILLTERVIEERPVDIVGKEPDVWRERLETFRAHLFGKTRNSEHCTLLNPEVLELTVDDEVGRFEATSPSPLIIENRALGYRIELIIRFFTVDHRQVRISGWPRFVDLMPASGEERDRWQNERARAYHGSIRHFLAALIRGRLREEGFRLSQVREIHPFRRMSVVRESALRDRMLTFDPPTNRYTLFFEHYLRIDYLAEEPERDFREYAETMLGWDRAATNDWQVSWLRLLGLSAMVMPDGIPIDPSQLETYGYWAWERVGEWLPLDFRP